MKVKKSKKASNDEIVQDKKIDAEDAQKVKIIKNKKKRNKRKNKKTENATKSAEISKEQALEYLKQWKSDRDNWTFKKKKQTWLLKNAFSQEQSGGSEEKMAGPAWARRGEEQFWKQTRLGLRHQNRRLPLLDFTVMTYNILSPDLAADHPELYTKCIPQALDWGQRSRALIDKIKSCNPDIVCLQEVYEDYFWFGLKPALETLGYCCQYKKKTGDKKDGCAMLVNKSKFCVEELVTVEFNRDESTLLCRDNIGLVALLKPRHSESRSSRLCVATSHLLYNPKRGDIRLAQLMVLLAEIHRLARQPREEHHPVILCGDFNSLPFSPLYKLVVQGTLALDNLISSKVSGTRAPKPKNRKNLDIHNYVNDTIGISTNCKYAAPPLRPANPCLRHMFSFCSAYNHYTDSGEPEISTRHNQAKENVDYIFYSAPRHRRKWPIVHLASLSLPSSSQISKNYLPSLHQPSDHFPLVAHFGWDLSS